MIRVLVIDDEIHAREEMETLLHETGKVEVVGTCANAFEALKAINTLRPEVIFLDIQMPMVNGFELLNMINQDIMPHVVFVTAFDEYSLKAFEEKTLDYLLKPVAMERLEKTVTKLKDLLGRQEVPAYKADVIKRIPCLIGKRIKLVGLGDVEYVSTGAAGNYIVTAAEQYYTDITLKVLQERTALVRCHKQYLINMDYVDEIVLLENGLGMITTPSGQVPVSRRYLKEIKGKLLL
ncbi:two-component system response regulator BtsR [Maridesulfovibrio hydrothermalis]|uniref:Response regulator in two-component system with YehU n=1 Tax=Maridesulfovibrio hydrothermalis AM13 = DSM 14728 TaxID=1121451 RepID=L0RCG7_9BACT|nr:two-component system response regulator BtsR [Maridesulfovibrio hydrothermalis]CCO24429.1 response regulator in two-component system with YehU [Maridesulfovibrio hydrothermalis AM13 = DSM 14728]